MQQTLKIVQESPISQVLSPAHILNDDDDGEGDGGESEVEGGSIESDIDLICPASPDRLSSLDGVSASSPNCPIKLAPSPAPLSVAKKALLRPDRPTVSFSPPPPAPSPVLVLFLGFCDMHGSVPSFFDPQLALGL